MIWTHEAVATLRRLWETDISTAQIARQMVVSKCTVIGKAHRLGLSGRASPIKLTSEPRPLRAQPLAPGARTLPPLPSERLAESKRTEGEGR